MEVMEGTLLYILNDAVEKKREKNEDGKVFVSELFPQPEFNDVERNASVPSQILVDKRNNAAEQRKLLEISLIADYELTMYIDGSKPEKL